VDEPQIGSWAFADSWIKVDETDDPNFFVNVLDGTRAGLLERARRRPAEFFAPLHLERGHRVLDVGCGTGDLLRLLAPLVEPGEAVGIDLSETMVAEARRRHGSQVPGLRFDVGDVFALAFGDASFDRVLASQVLLHVPSVEAALTEIARVLDSRGQLSLTEIDWGSISVECSDRELARRFTALACDGLRNGMIVRDLPTMLRSVGLSDLDIQPELAVSWEPDAFHTWFVEPSVRHFVRVGTFTEDEGERFLGDLRNRAESGRYFSARTTYTLTARRPHESGQGAADRS
jgi:SAM-dependent methyltransferase